MNEEATAGICSAVVVSIDQVRGGWVQQEGVTVFVPPEFRQLAELVELFGIAIDSSDLYQFLLQDKSVLDKEQTIAEACANLYVRALTREMSTFATTFVDAKRNL
jgi:hypothetical protein